MRIFSQPHPPGLSVFPSCPKSKLFASIPLLPNSRYGQGVDKDREIPPSQGIQEVPVEEHGPGSSPLSKPARRTGAPALRLHLTLVIGLSICLFAGWFELTRALGGNSLSWAYVFEWPLFGIFAIYLWWKLLHDDGSDPRPSAEPLDAETAQKLEVWNNYLAELRAQDPPRDQS